MINVIMSVKNQLNIADVDRNFIGILAYLYASVTWIVTSANT